MKSNAVFADTLLILALGCGKPEATGPAPAPKMAPSKIAGWTEAQTSGIAISLPSTWKPFDMTSPDYQKGLDELAKANPGMSTFAKSAHQMAETGTIKLFVVNPGAASAFAAQSATISIVAAPQNMTTDQAADQIKSALVPRVAVGTTVTTEKVSYPAGDFVKLTAETKPPNASDNIQATEFMTIHDSKLVIVTYSTLKSKTAELAPTMDQSMKTLRFQ